MSLRRRTEVLLFTIAGAAHLALGWNYRTVDYAFFRHQGEWPLASLFVATVYALTGLLACTKWRIQGIVYAKVIAVLYLFVLMESLGTFPEYAQLFPSVLVLLIRNDVFVDRNDRLLDGRRREE
jgi:hypothetical protein